MKSWHLERASQISDNISMIINVKIGCCGQFLENGGIAKILT